MEPQSYRYRLVFYPGGHGTGLHTHAAIRLDALQGRYDPILTWPPPFDLGLSLLEQHGSGHICYGLRSDDNGNFIQPDWETFVPLPLLQDPHSNYVRDDVMYVKVTKLPNAVPDTALESVSSVNVESFSDPEV